MKMPWLIRSIFYKAPKVADTYIDDFTESNPFKNRIRVRVLETKKGWVRYTWIGSSIWTNETMTVSQFNGCWIKEPPK
jgi:hypothetical protein